MSNEFIDAGMEMVNTTAMVGKTIAGVVVSHNEDQMLIFFDDKTFSCFEAYSGECDATIGTSPSYVSAIWYDRNDIEVHVPPSVVDAIDAAILARRLESQRLEDESERQEYERLRAKFEEGGA